MTTEHSNVGQCLDQLPSFLSGELVELVNYGASQRDVFNRTVLEEFIDLKDCCWYEIKVSLTWICLGSKSVHACWEIGKPWFWIGFREVKDSMSNVEVLCKPTTSST